jgi:YesN/AraC family two-component response regulator
MYKLIIVDDESAIRHGIKNYFPWTQLGFEVAGLFENGRQALEYCQKLPVDVVLSDIKMPIMDGLELAKELYQLNSEIKIILLSGYREFEYAREALKYEVKNYILKPTKYEELYEVFSEIKEELDQEQILNVESDLQEDNTDRSYYDKIIDTVKSYLYQNYRIATLNSASELVHLSPNYLSTLFKDITGEYFSDFLLRIRMEEAAKLLNDIRYKTYQISDLVGYSNPKNFTRAFKKYYGLTPTEFRNPPT